MQDTYKPKTQVGKGGEIHQQADAKSPTLNSPVLIV